MAITIPFQHPTGSIINRAEDDHLAVMATKAKYSNPDTFGQIVVEYQRPIYNLCFRMLHDAAEAEDAAQEAFIRAYTRFETFDPSRKFSTWLFAIASHYCLDRLKKRRLPQVFWDEVPEKYVLADDEADQPEHVLLDAEASAEIHALLSHLAPEYRSVVVLKYWHGMRCEEIAETMGISVGAVKSKLFRGRKKMAGVLQETYQKEQYYGIRFK